MENNEKPQLPNLRHLSRFLALKYYCCYSPILFFFIGLYNTFVTRNSMFSPYCIGLMTWLLPMYLDASLKGKKAQEKESPKELLAERYQFTSRASFIYHITYYADCILLLLWNIIDPRVILWNLFALPLLLLALSLAYVTIASFAIRRSLHRHLMNADL